jgi:multidrug efflux pump subunit AcrB
MDVSLNMVSLFAFIISLGIVVDDAIVVGENIYDYHQQGMPFARAAVIGAREVAMPVIFSILTNIAAFMPLFFVPGFMGKVFRFIPAVVITVFTISLIESIFILPSHLGHQRDISPGGLSGWLHARQRRFSNWFARMIRNVYGPFLDFALHYRYLTLAIGVAVLCITIAYIRSGRMGMSMFPRVESDQAVANAVLPYGSAVESTIAVQDQLIAAAQRVIEENGGTNLAEGIYAEVGRGSGGISGGHVARIRVLLTPPGQRPIGTAEFVEQWREYTGAVPGMESLSFQSDFGGPGSGAALTIELSHRNVDTLEQASADLAEALTVFPNAKDIDDGYSPGKKQFDFTILPAGQSLGFSAMDVARGVRHAFYGAEALRQQRGRDEVKVMVRLPKHQRVSAYDLEELLIRTPDGGEMPFRDMVQITRGRAYTTLNRRNGRRVVSVTADVTPHHQAGQVLEALKAGALPGLVKKYPGLQFSFEGRQADMRESLSSLGYGFILAMFLVYALLAIPLKSYTLPMIIMVSIPFGIVGAVIGHIIMGYSLSIISMMGIVALSGVVVNDSLVLLEFANRQYRAGMTAFNAVHAAGIRRFRPIMLTTLTTFGGLAPMIFETSRQARFLIPMAISLGFGILFATFISLLLVPCLYVTLEDFRRLMGFEVVKDVSSRPHLM